MTCSRTDATMILSTGLGRIASIFSSAYFGERDQLFRLNVIGGSD